MLTSKYEQHRMPREYQVTADSRLPHHCLDDPDIEAFFHLEPMMAAIGVTVTSCILWFLTIFILYQITRCAL